MGKGQLLESVHPEQFEHHVENDECLDGWIMQIVIVMNTNPVLNQWNHADTLSNRPNTEVFQ